MSFVIFIIIYKKNYVFIYQRGFIYHERTSVTFLETRDKKQAWKRTRRTSRTMTDAISLIVVGFVVGLILLVVIVIMAAVGGFHVFE